LNEKTRSGLSPQTVRHIRTVLRRALNFAIKWKKVSFNNATVVELPKADRAEIHPLSEEQARRLLEVAKGTELETFLVLAIRLGLRRGELLDLQWSDINSEDRVLTVSRAIQRIPGQPLAPVRLKTRGSRRTIELIDEVVTALKQHRTRQAERRLLLGRDWNDRGLVFPNSIGKPLEPRHIKSSPSSSRAPGYRPRRGRTTAVIPAPVCCSKRAPSYSMSASSWATRRLRSPLTYTRISRRASDASSPDIWKRF